MISFNLFTQYFQSRSKSLRKILKGIVCRSNNKSGFRWFLVKCSWSIHLSKLLFDIINVNIKFNFENVWMIIYYLYARKLFINLTGIAKTSTRAWNDWHMNSTSPFALLIGIITYLECRNVDHLNVVLQWFLLKHGWIHIYIWIAHKCPWQSNLTESIIQCASANN